MVDEWYAVRCVFQWTEAEGRPYEERITVWRCRGVLAAARQPAAAGAVPRPPFRHRLRAPERAL